MSKQLILGLMAALCLAAAPAYAITVDDVIGLTRADANDAIILSKIEADGTVFHLTVDEIIHLKEVGVSDVVITFMINTGKGALVEDDEYTPVEEEYEDEYEYEQDSQVADEDYRGDLDSQYRSSVHVSFGYYYPHWPGYQYGFYYDPFYWPSWSYYYAFWSPYPYWNWYYYPWRWQYYDYCHSYYRHNTAWYGYYHYNDNDGHPYTNRVTKTGRSVGSRGTPAAGGGRVTKVPNRRSKDEDRAGINRTRDRVKMPSRTVPDVRPSTPAPTKPSKPSGAVQPRAPRPKVQPDRGGSTPKRPEVKPSRPAKETVKPPSRSAPNVRPSTRPSVSPSRSSSPSRSAPSRSPASSSKTRKGSKG